MTPLKEFNGDGPLKQKKVSRNKFYVMSFFLFLDLGLNSTLDFDPYSQGKSGFIVLGLLGLQLIVQISIFLILFLTIADTFLFRVGLLGLLTKKIRGVLLLQAVYFAITIAAGVTRVSHYDDHKDLMSLTELKAFVGLSIVQKIVALGYYIMNITTIIRLTDPIYFNKHAWLQVIRESFEKETN